MCKENESKIYILTVQSQIDRIDTGNYGKNVAMISRALPDHESSFIWMVSV